MDFCASAGNSREALFISVRREFDSDCRDSLHGGLKFR